MAGDHDLLVLSNRGPLSISRSADGRCAARAGRGGLVVTLGPGVERDGALWLAAGVGRGRRGGGPAGVSSMPRASGCRP